MLALPVRSERRESCRASLGENCPGLELTLIGLFCFEAFNYEKLREEMLRLLGVDLDGAERTQIRKGKFIVRVDGKDSGVSVKDLKAAVEKGCSRCSDFTAECSDVSVGSVGSEEGYSTVIVRSPLGQRLLENLELNRGNVRKEEIVKLASLKKKRALNS